MAMKETQLKAHSEIYRFGYTEGVGYIYFLVSGQEVVYIGKSENVDNRIKDHRNRDWDTCYVLRVDKRNVGAVEQALIRCIEPEMNRQYCSQEPSPLDRMILEEYGLDT